MLKLHWPEYLIEAFGLGILMLVISLFGTLIYSPNSPVNDLINIQFFRDILMGIVVGITLIILIYSPWGKRSGAHFNPAVTLSFYRLQKLNYLDTLFYVISQFIGGLLGIFLAIFILGNNFTQPPINYLVTLPGIFGPTVAFITELMLSFGLMLMILVTSNVNQLSKYTGIFSGVLLTIYIALAVPISGMSINPARSFASAFPAQIWDFFWIYYFAPSIGMLVAAEIYHRYFDRPKTICCKIHPNNEHPCISANCCGDCNDLVRYWRTDVIQK